MLMNRTVIATQMPDPYHGFFAKAVTRAEFVRLPIGIPEVPPGIEILVAVPFADPGERLPATSPTGWPFDLKWTQLVTVGLDFYPNWFFNGQTVTIGRGRSSIALAEYALAAILSAAKRMPEIWISQPAQWQRIPIYSVAGSTLGIVGFGGVGEALAPRAQALGMHVLALRQSDRPLALGVERAPDMATLFAHSDHVVLAVPSTPATRHIVDAQVLGSAKPGLHLINVARGALIDDDALIRALNSGRIGLASLDATNPEPAPDGHPFYSHPRIRLSPHIGTNTTDNVEGLAERFALNLNRYRAGEPLLDLADISQR